VANPDGASGPAQGFSIRSALEALADQCGGGDPALRDQILRELKVFESLDPGEGP